MVLPFYCCRRGRGFKAPWSLKPLILLLFKGLVSSRNKHILQNCHINNSFSTSLREMSSHLMMADVIPPWNNIGTSIYDNHIATFQVHCTLLIYDNFGCLYAWQLCFQLFALSSCQKYKQHINVTRRILISSIIKQDSLHLHNNHLRVGVTVDLIYSVSPRTCAQWPPYSSMVYMTVISQEQALAWSSCWL